MGGVGIFMASQGVDLENIFGVQMVPAESDDSEGMIELLSEEERQQKLSTPEYEPPATELAIYAFLMYLLLFISTIGLWNMRRWGVFLFVPLMAANIAVLFLVKPEWLGPSQGTPWFSLLLPAIYFVVVLPFWKRIGKESETVVT
jgi:phosphatidylserine synthase